MKIERQEQILKEIRALKRRLHLIERQVATSQKAKAASPRATFQKKYPHIHIDPRLFKFVGIDPPLSLEEEKREIQRSIAARFEVK